MTRSQCVSKMESIKGKIAELQRQYKQCEDEVKRIDSAKCTKLLVQHNVDPEVLEEILRMYSSGKFGMKPGKAAKSIAGAGSLVSDGDSDGSGAAEDDDDSAGAVSDGGSETGDIEPSGAPWDEIEEAGFPQELLNDEGGSEE